MGIEIKKNHKSTKIASIVRSSQTGIHIRLATLDYSSKAKVELEMANPSIPIVDLSPFFREDDDDSKKKIIEIIGEACSEYEFFQIVNHGVPLGLISQALELSKTFFDFPDEEKHKCSANSSAPLPAGYSKQPEHSPDKNEYLLVFPPWSNFSVYPTNPSEFR